LLIGYVFLDKSDDDVVLHFKFLAGSLFMYILCGLKVVVSTKSPRSDKQYVWEGKVNASSYTIAEETDPEKLIPRGTRLTLHLKICRKFPFSTFCY